MRRLVGAVAVLGMLALTGCGGGEPLPTLPPTPSATPVFASEEEALAAAEQAYAAYSRASDLVFNSGGSEPERIAPYVTDSQFKRESDTAGLFMSRGIRSIGSPVVTLFELQQHVEENNVAHLVVYVCLDVSEVRVIDSSGVDVTPIDRQPVAPLEVGFVAEDPSRVLIESSEQWPGSSFC